MQYFELVPKAFKTFSVRRALHTGWPTVKYYLNRQPLPPSDKPALFTMNIMPPMLTVWHHFVRKHLGDRVDTVVFDCSGTVDPALLPGVRVQKFLNLYAATKSDEFLYHIATHRRLGWICDDDMFIMSDQCLDRIEQEFSDPTTASLSFRPRNWWHFDLNGKQYEPSSSYCTVIDRNIYCDKEQLSLAPCDGNTNAVSHIGKQVRRYDTFDKANEQLLQRGYRCAVVPEAERNNYITGFSGVSSAVMLLWYFRNKQQMLDYLQEPADKAWRGNTLYTIVSGLLAVQAMQELHETLTGKPYVLPAMPSKADLETLAAAKAPLLREGHDFNKTRIVAEQLRASL